MFGAVTSASSPGFPLRNPETGASVVRVSSVLTASFASDVTSLLFSNIGGFNRLAYYITIAAAGGGPSQAQVRLAWTNIGSPGAAEFLDLRRDATDATVDDLNLPSVPAGTSQRFLLAIINPGGAVGARLLMREVASPLTPGTATVAATAIT